MLDAGDNCLEEVPAALGRLPSLQSLLLPGNRIVAVHPALLAAPRLRTLDLHRNPITAATLEATPGCAALRPCLYRGVGLVGLKPCTHGRGEFGVLRTSFNTLHPTSCIDTPRSSSAATAVRETCFLSPPEHQIMHPTFAQVRRV